MTRKTRVEQIEEVGINPGITEDKGSLTWNNSTGKYEHKEKSDIDHTHSNSSVLYTTSSPTTNEIGNIPLNTEYVDEPIISVIDKMLHKYQKPTIPSFTISQNPLLLEIGTILDGDKTFSWTKTHPDNIPSGIGVLKEIIGNVTIDTSVDILGLNSKIIPMVIPNVVPILKRYQLQGIDTEDNSFVSPIIELQTVYPVFHGFVTQSNKPLASELSITTNKRPIISSGDVTFSINSGAMDWSWIAIPQGSQFTNWYENVENAGLIGPTGLFATGVAISLTSAQWSNVPYWVYITNWRGAVNTLILKH